MRVLRPSLLVDVNRVAGLDDVDERQTARVRVGATVRQADPRLLAHPSARSRRSRTSATRSRATAERSCGSIAHADAAAELPLALVATRRLGGRGVDRGRREIPADELFVGPYTTALEPDELLVETVWPLLDDADGFAFDELAQRGGDYALCMAACSRPGRTSCASSSAP